ncbi:hypothetical protein [Sinorhizobium mexicanum]|nr:hypothetical protein [Sinorhizobium mexicanum]MBP1884996.1 hypothetical protein [Sinorhizobium mexicanum]
MAILHLEKLALIGPSAAMAVSEDRRGKSESHPRTAEKKHP